MNISVKGKVQQEENVCPCLAVVSVGDDKASEIYIRNKKRACDKTGILFRHEHLEHDCTQDDLERTVKLLAEDQSVHGIIVQLPIPENLNAGNAIALIPQEKDVDGLCDMNAGQLLHQCDGFVPCTPKGIMRLLDIYRIPTDGKHAVVVGRSDIVGKPMSLLLLNSNATVTMCHSHTRNLSAITANADILVVAVGKPGFITADMVKPGSAVIDVGINRVDGKVVGDVDFQSVCHVAKFITPVPGGVGPMTVAELMDNVWEAYKIQMKEG